MTRRVEPRDYRLGAPDSSDPEKIDELRARQEKHRRLTGGKPERAFLDVLKSRMRKLRGEPDDDEDTSEGEDEEPKEALLALHPSQKPALANKKKVIVKG